jgi:hypothetical protein
MDGERAMGREGVSLELCPSEMEGGKRDYQYCNRGWVVGLEMEDVGWMNR